MLKADFLGLSTMGMISRALTSIGMTLDELYQIPLDDPETLDAFHRADVVGVFQFEGRATRLMTMEVKPDTFMEISDINALSRPGPLFSGASAQYIDIKHGHREAEHLHPIVDKYTAFSHYQIIYQEQVLGIIREMGGFSVAKVSFIRRVISQKYGEQQFNTVFEDFIRGAKELHNIPEALATRIWKLMVTSATYSFNLAHCISYAIIGYWCMWLKVHYPVEFYAAQLSKTDKEKWPTLIKDARDNAHKFGRDPIDILPPDVRFSGATWEPHPEKHAVLAGLTQVPGIAEKSAEAIQTFIAEQDIAQDAMSWEDLAKVRGIGPKTIKRIIKWVNSDDPFKLYYAERILGELRQVIARRQMYVPMSATYTSDEIPRDADNLEVIWMGIIKTREYKDFLEDERARSGKTVDEIKAEMDRPDLVKSCVLKCYDDGDEDVYLRFNRYRFPNFEEMLESVRVDGTHVIIARGMKRKGFGLNLQVKHAFLIDVEEDEEEDDD